MTKNNQKFICVRWTLIIVFYFSCGILNWNQFQVEMNWLSSMNLSFCDSSPRVCVFSLGEILIGKICGHVNARHMRFICQIDAGTISWINHRILASANPRSCRDCCWKNPMHLPLYNATAKHTNTQTKKQQKNKQPSIWSSSLRLISWH